MLAIFSQIYALFGVFFRSLINVSVVLQNGQISGMSVYGTWWYWVIIIRYWLALDGTGSVYGFYSRIYWKKWRFGQVLPIPHTQQQNIGLLTYLACLKFEVEASHATWAKKCEAKSTMCEVENTMWEVEKYNAWGRKIQFLR